MRNFAGLLGVALASCASGGLGYDAELPRAETFDLQGEKLRIGMRDYVTSDCSNEEFFCRAVPDLSITIQLPKTCPKFRWIPPQGSEWIYKHPVGHGGRAYYQMRGRTDVEFVFSPAFGVETIIFLRGDNERQAYTVSRKSYPLKACNSDSFSE